MSKLYFVMNNRENISEGYSEVSEETFRNYINSFPEGERAYFINLGYAIMETDEAGYRNFYKEYRRERYIEEEARRAGMVSLNAIDSDELDGTGVLVDTSEPFEEKVQREIVIEKLPEAISILNEEEKTLVREIYFNGLSERDLSVIYGVSNIAIHKRKLRILKKLQKFFQV